MAAHNVGNDDGYDEDGAEEEDEAEAAQAIAVAVVEEGDEHQYYHNDPSYHNDDSNNNDGSDDSKSDDNQNLISQVLLRIHASNLPRYGILQSLPDVFAVVSYAAGPIGGGHNRHHHHHHQQQHGVSSPSSTTSNSASFDHQHTTNGTYGFGRDSHGQSIVEWGRTEIIKKCKNPQWTKTFTIDYEYGSEFYFFVQVYRFVNSKEKPIPLGNAVCEIGDILGTKNNTKVKRLPKGGAVFCRLEPVQTSHLNRILRFQFGARELTSNSRNSSKRGNLSKMIMNSATSSTKPPNTILEIAKNNTSTYNQQPWTTVYRSCPVNDSWEPVWDVGEVDLAVCCNGDLDLPIRLSVLVHRKKRGKNKLIGVSETTVRAILNTQRDYHADFVERDQSAMGFILQKTSDSMERVGRLHVRLAQVVDNVYGEDISGAICTEHDDTSRNGSVVDADVPNLPRTVSFREVKDPFAVDIAALPTLVAAPATFHDYVQDGCQLDFCVAIDFTSSNGDPRIPGSLHDQSDGNFNDYEETITSIGNALAVYSELFNVWGFGAKFNGVTRHLFQCGSTGIVQGVEGILEAYRSVFRNDLIMSGPTVFDEVIRAAAVRARKHQQSMTHLKRYTVLLIVTDGIPTPGAIEETKRKLGVYGSVPLSVIFVGVGRSDFSVMHQLCNGDFGQRRITTFVSFRQHQYDPTVLGKAALTNIPNQVVEYMLQNGIRPSNITT